MTFSCKDKSIERLQRALNAVEQLKRLPRFSPQFNRWRRNTRVAIQNTFTHKPECVNDFTAIRYSPSGYIAAMPGSPCEVKLRNQAFVQGLELAASMLESMIDEIKEYWEDDDQSVQAADVKANEPETTRRIFVVHGRDDGAKETVARLLTELDLKPIVLHEHPNQGRTIIEKFEQYSDVGFAVVLLTPDDSCTDSHQSATPRPRPRQNVILELGFFLGKLGRGRTYALKKGDMELPSDYSGVLYISMDDQEGWKLKLAEELQAAGLDIDANLLLRGSARDRNAGDRSHHS